MTRTDAAAFDGRRVLVTGGLGFIGSTVAVALVRAGARVTVLDALIGGHGGLRTNLDPFADRCDVRIGDLRDLALTRAAVRDQEIVFHCAGQTSHIASVHDPRLDRELNVDASRCLLEACRQESPDTRLVLASTRQVYGRPDSLPVAEGHPVAPVDPNGAHKRTVEELFRAYAQTRGLRSTILRLTNVYGPRQQIRNDQQGFVGILIRRALLGQRLQLFGTGRQVRDFSYVDDTVTALLRAGSSEACVGRTFNVGSPDRHPLTELARLLHDKTGTGHDLLPFPPEREQIDIGDFYADDRAFRETTGWSPQVRLTEGLDRTLAAYRREPGRYRD